MTGNDGHELKSIVAPSGVRGPGILTCQCGWMVEFQSIAAALVAHETHQVLVKVLARVTWGQA